MCRISSSPITCGVRPASPIISNPLPPAGKRGSQRFLSATALAAAPSDPRRKGAAGPSRKRAAPPPAAVEWPSHAADHPKSPRRGDFMYTFKRQFYLKHENLPLQMAIPPFILFGPGLDVRPEIQLL